MENVNVGEFTKFFENLKIKEIMKTSVETLHMDDELTTAEEKFVQKRIHYLPVLNSRSELMGLLSQKYLYKTRSPRKLMSNDVQFDHRVVIDGDSFYDKGILDGYILSHVMNKNPTTLGPDDSLAKALLLMSRKKVTCIAIIDKDRTLLGLLTDLEIIDMISTIIDFRSKFK